MANEVVKTLKENEETTLETFFCYILAQINLNEDIDKKKYDDKRKKQSENSKRWLRTPPNNGVCDSEAQFNFTWTHYKGPVYFKTITRNNCPGFRPHIYGYYGKYNFGEFIFNSFYIYSVVMFSLAPFC